MPKVRKAVLGDAVELGTVGPAAYSASYGYLWDDSAAFARWLTTFSADAFDTFLRRSDTHVWVTEIDGSIVGFLTMIVGSKNPATGEAGGAEIPRIYMLPGVQGMGLGKQMVEVAISQARDEGLSHVWLDHMLSADYAGRTYRKWGFTPIGTWTFDQPVKSEFKEMGGLVFRL